MYASTHLVTVSLLRFWQVAEATGITESVSTDTESAVAIAYKVVASTRLPCSAARIVRAAQSASAASCSCVQPIRLRESLISLPLASIPRAIRKFPLLSLFKTAAYDKLVVRLTAKKSTFDQRRLPVTIHAFSRRGVDFGVPSVWGLEYLDRLTNPYK